MNYDFKTDCDSNNNCNSNAKNSSEIDLDNLTFEFISEINDKLYEDLSNIANICNKFDNVKNTFFIDNEDCETTIDNEQNENIFKGTLVAIGLSPDLCSNKLLG